MDDLDNLNCPQYVCFKTEILRQNQSSNCLRSSLNLSLKDNSMAVEEQNLGSSIEDQPIPNNLRSPLSENYINYQTSPGGYSLRSKSGVEDYPVFKSNLSLSGKAFKKNSKNGTNTGKTRAVNGNVSSKRKREDEYIPLAEQVAAFQRKTPERFHSTGPKAFLPQKHWSPLPLTQPVSPNLQAAKRIRGTHVMSQEEKEAIEAEEMKRYCFRARPIKDAILHRRENLKPTKKSLTKPMDIQLRTAQRAAEANSTSKVEDKPYEFHARPVPAAVFNGPTGLKEIPVPSLTQPKTPNFRLKERAEKWKSHVHLNETFETFKANPIPVFDAVPEIKHEKKCTEIKPFSFDSKDKERILQKEKKIMEKVEQENRVYQFRAHPMPSPSPSVLPAVPKKHVTEPEPFNFLSQHKTSTLCNSVGDLSDSFSNFKARPASVLKKPPFLPEKSGKHIVEVKEFQLHTEVRASERLKQKEINAIKEQEKLLVLQQIKQLHEEEEQREIAKLRKEMVHKANPIRLYAPVEIKPSSKPLTEPVSPKLKTDQRLQKKNSVE